MMTQSRSDDELYEECAHRVEQAILSGALALMPAQMVFYVHTSQCQRGRDAEARCMCIPDIYVKQPVGITKIDSTGQTYSIPLH